MENLIILLGSAEHIKAYIESKEVLIDNAGDHSSLRISKQMTPVCEETLGCHILVLNCILGGL